MSGPEPRGIIDHLKKPSVFAALVLSLGLCATPAIALEAGGIRFAEVVSVGGKPQGKDIAGDKFFGALLRVWLGDKPVQADLKAKLPGK